MIMLNNIYQLLTDFSHMNDTPTYTTPALSADPANIALWAQASFFIYMCGTSIFELDTMTLSSDPDYAFTAMSGVGAAVLLFQVRYSRLIALLIVPMLAILEDPFFLIFGLLWFGPLIFLPALAYDEFGQGPLFGVWTRKGWGTVLLTLFLLFNIMDTGVPDIATEDQIVEEYESDYDGLADVVAECEAASDCSFLDAEGDDAEVITAWKVGSMEKNVAYIGMILLPLSILALIGKATGLLKIERLTPTIAGVALVGFFWIDTILWNTVTHAGISLEELYLLPVSGVILMSIHGLYTAPMSETK